MCRRPEVWAACACWWTSSECRRQVLMPFFDPGRILFWPFSGTPRASSETAHWANKNFPWCNPFRMAELLKWRPPSYGTRRVLCTIIWLKKYVCGRTAVQALNFVSKMCSCGGSWIDFVDFIGFFSVDVYISCTFKLLSTRFYHSDPSWPNILLWSDGLSS